MVSPAISNNEALIEEVEHFYKSIKENKKTITSGEMGYRVVRILEAANESMRNNGQLVEL